MSQVLIQQYLNQLQDLRKVSGTHRESVVREAFKDLLKGWARSHDLVFIPEYEIETKAKDRRYVDGALLYELRMPFGYWEAKDEKDDLDAEIEHVADLLVDHFLGQTETRNLRADHAAGLRVAVEHGDVVAERREIARHGERRRPRAHAGDALAVFALRGRNPDVLSCIANLSNDEVFTPPDALVTMSVLQPMMWSACTGRVISRIS